MFIIFICIFISFRNVYTMFIYNKAGRATSKYTAELIKNHRYDLNAHYHSTMKINFLRYIFSFWLWTVTDAFKPEYRELMKEYV